MGYYNNEVQSMVAPEAWAGSLSESLLDCFKSQVMDGLPVRVPSINSHA